MNWWDRYKEKSKWKTAYHEAAHAVIAYRLGARVAEVYLDAEGGGEAFWHHDWFRFEDLIVITMAGDIAGRRFFPKYTFGGLEYDHRKIDMHLSSIRYGTRRANRLYFRNVTKRMVEENWAAISRVASLLMKHRKLTGNEVVRAIRRSPKTSEIKAMAA